ncbi:hypothetical protein JNA92_14735 [Pseudomonas putida]|nr:hypothetical protein [Pseudomonas putida]
MKNIIMKLWEQELLPIKDAIYFSSGEACSCKIATYPSPSIKIGEKFSLEDFHATHKCDVCHIDILKEIPLTNGGYCCVGEGSYGPEGFIAYLDKEKELIWVIYSESSNPFIDVTQVNDKTISTRSTTDIKITIDLENPQTLDFIQQRCDQEGGLTPLQKKHLKYIKQEPQWFI